VALPPSPSCVQPLQPSTKHNVNKQLSLSSHITKQSSQHQQLDTSSQSNDDVDFNNTKQPPLSTQQITEPQPQLKSDVLGESERIGILSNLDMFAEFGVQDKLVRAMSKLSKGAKLSPYLELVRGRYDAMNDIGQYSSADEILSAINSRRESRNNIFIDMRRTNAEFELYAHNGQPPRPEVHNVIALSFCTLDCLRNCLKRDGPETDNLIDFDNHCLSYLRNYLLNETLKEGGTVTSPALSAAFFDDRVDYVDFFQMSCTSNDYATLEENLESLWTLQGGNLSFTDFLSVTYLDSTLNLIERGVFHFAVHGSPLTILNCTFRNSDKGLKGDRDRSSSPNGVFEQLHTNHPQHIAQGGLKSLPPSVVTRVAEDLAYFASRFDGLEMSDGTLVQAKNALCVFIERKGGLRGGPNAHDRAMEAEQKKKMASNQSNATSMFYNLRETTDNTNEDILAIIQNVFDTPSMKHVKACVVEPSEALALFRQLEENHPEWNMQKALAELEKSSMFTEMANARKRKLINWVKRMISSVELNKLKKSGMSSEDGIAELKKSGKLSAEDKWLETNDKQGQAWAIHRKWKAQKSLEEICEMIRADKNLGDKFANLIHNSLTSVENNISRETQGMQQQVAKAQKELENGKKVLVGTHRCNNECLIVWNDEHHTKDYRDNRKGGIKIKRANCGCCGSHDRDFTFKSAVTNSWETLIFDQVSNSNVVQLTSVAALTSFSKKKERSIRQRHESEASATNEDSTNDSTASSAVAAKQPPAKKEKATKSKSASSKKTQSKSKRKPSEEKEEKKKKLKKLDSSKDSKMAAPTKKKDISEKAVPKKKSTKSKPIVGSSSKAASKLASKSSKSADTGSSNKKEKKIDINADRRFFIVKKVHKNDLATVQAELDRLINEFREQLDRATIVKEFINVYRNEWREDMFEGLRNWLQELATSDSDSDDY